MQVWKRDERTGIECGINDDGELYLGDDRSGFNLPDTEENREVILRDFDYYVKFSLALQQG
jgi:hypothetical protein